jgi:hypothetical protein
MWQKRKENSDQHKNRQATVHIKAATEDIPKAFLFSTVAETAVRRHKP